MRDAMVVIGTLLGMAFVVTSLATLVYLLG